MLEKQERIAELVKRHNALTRLIEERAVWYQDHPIGSSGLYIGRYKIVGSQDAPALIEVFSLDRETLRELRMIETQMSSETGAAAKGPSESEKWNNVIQTLNAGRQRVADEKLAREANERSQTSLSSDSRQSLDSPSTKNCEE